jgi:hypothetical protein
MIIIQRFYGLLNYINYYYHPSLPVRSPKNSQCGSNPGSREGGRVFQKKLEEPLKFVPSPFPPYFFLSSFLFLEETQGSDGVGGDVRDQQECKMTHL